MTEASSTGTEPVLRGESLAKRVLRVVCAVSMVSVGVLHFVKPDGFVRIVPAFLPAPLLLVYVSGFFEVCGGVGILMRPPIRAIAAYGLICLYIAVFPANINMAVHHIQLSEGGTMSPALMWARLPLQALFVAWAYWLRH
ncbi:MAG: hypothetical protein U0174_09230 [Polyangiaceae bacterium]